MRIPFLTRRLTLVAGLLLLGTAPTRAQATHELLHGLDATPPRQFQGALVQGADGLLYGTGFKGGDGGAGGVFRIGTNGSGFTQLHYFVFSGDAGPYAGLIQGLDGAFYGTTSVGGGGGTVFKISGDGSVFTRLHYFDGSDGDLPYGELVQGPDGTLYGTTFQGGAFSSGTVFSVGADGSGFTQLHSFDFGHGGHPYAGLVLGPGGTLYGTASSGGASSAGVLFKIKTDGSGYATIHEFDGSDGSYPYAGLLLAADGLLYGTTDIGGASNLGVLFKLATDGSGFTKLRDLAFADGAYPDGTLIQDADGVLYGSAYSGGASDAGTLFKLETDGSAFAVVHNFDGSGGRFPQAALLQDEDGILYGTTIQGGASNLGTLFKVGTDGSGFTLLNAPVPSSAANLQAALTLGSDDSFYGTTLYGGGSDVGTVFKMAADGGAFTVLHEFAYADGANPYSGVIQGADGALYGTTQNGASSNGGSVFKISTNGSGFTTLHEFDFTDGGNPSGNLAQGADGFLYGTATGGGSFGPGTVFKMSTDGSVFTIFHEFNYTDGAFPVAGLIQGADGRLYGTTLFGGTQNRGTVFRIGTDGLGFTVIHDFDGSTGFGPLAALVQGPDGVLYGTAVTGGTGFVGTVFRLNPDGSGFATIHDFAYDSTSGRNPQTALVLGAGGFLYGTTSFGGTSDLGTAFRLRTDGRDYGKLYDFDTSTGAVLQASLVSAFDGMLYGAAFLGGPGHGGAIFRLTIDSDADAILDPADNCPFAANPGQEDGDANGVGDACQGLLSIDDVSVAEGNSGTANAVFTVSLYQASSETVTVEYATAPGTATSPADFTAAATTTLSFAPGQTSKPVTVKVKGDTKDEDDEAFVVNLSSPTHATLGDAQGQGTILDNDALPALSIVSVATAEGSGNNTVKLTVKLSPVSGRAVTVHYATADGTATTADNDYTASSGSLTFDPGQTSKTVSVIVEGDHTPEPDEALTVQLSSPLNATNPEPVGTLTLQNDDTTLPTPTVSINDVAINEGQAGSTSAVFSVTLSGPASGTVSVSYATANGTAVAPGDYTGKSSTLTFTPGQISKTVSIALKGDTDQEASETYFVNLSNPVGLTIADGSGLGTIQNDDAAPTLSILDRSVTEGNSGSKNITFTVALSAASTSTVTADYATADAPAGPGAASAGLDYVAKAGTVAFAPGQLSRTFTVSVKGDLLDESDEIFFVNLTGSTNAGILDAQATGTIVDNE